MLLTVVLYGGDAEIILWIDDRISSIPLRNCSSFCKDEELMLPRVRRHKNNFGLSLRILACKRNLLNTAELLLLHGAGICIQDADGRKTLAAAAFYWASRIGKGTLHCGLWQGQGICPLSSCCWTRAPGHLAPVVQGGHQPGS